MKRSALTITLLLLAIQFMAQVPTGISYQAVVRNNSGDVVASQSVKFRFSIHAGSATGPLVYRETHALTTNGFGLANLSIGKGVVTDGSFSAIDWGAAGHFLKIELDATGGTAFTHLGTVEMLSVPYAFRAKTVEVDAVNDADADPLNEIQSLTLTDLQLSLSKGGGSVTLPSSGGGDNWGSEYVHTDATLEGKGTTALPLKLAQQSATTGEVLKWNGTAWLPDADLSGSSVWKQSGADIYFNTGKVGIGKIPGTDLRQFQVLTAEYQAIAAVNNSSSYATLYVQNNGTGLSAEFKNPVKISDGSQGEGKVLTSNSLGIASWQPATITADAANFSGNGSAASPLKLSSMGASTGQVLKWNGTVWDNANDDPGPWSESDNAVYNSSSKKFGMGINVPTQKLTIADASTQCYMNLQNSTTGYNSTSGLLVGMDGNNGWLSTYESGNLYLGTSSAARVIIASDGDVGIGISVPVQRLDVNGAINIRGNGDLDIFCDNKEALWFNGTYFSWGYGGEYNYFGDEVTIGTSAVPGYTLVVNGTAAKTGGGSWSTLSDLRLKDLKGEYGKGLSEIIQLQPVKFTYKSGNPRGLDPEAEQIGFIAQEVLKVFPEAVNLCKDGYLDFNIHPVNVALVNAVRELKTENDRLKEELSQMKILFESRLSKLESHFEATTEK